MTSRLRGTMDFILISTVVLFAVTIPVQSIEPTITASAGDLSVLLNKTETLEVSIKGLPAGSNIPLTFYVQHDDLIEVDPVTVTLASNSEVYKVVVTGLHPGHTELTSNYTSRETGLVVDSIFVRVTVAISSIIATVSEVVGWVYFAAWSISFYPQIYINFKRKSVVGLNFDFVALNIVGFLMYTIFNAGLFWIPEIEQEYFQRHPRGLNPVLPNDIGFGVHAMFATLITIIQCFFYERAEQRVSTVARSILGVFAVAVVVFFVLVFTSTWHWLDFLYACSYIKLTITLIKYIPQALMNYRRKSTVGWSIGNILLDFTGGMLSMLQMILNAYNYDDWNSIFGDPTKFGLGLFSVCFDILFMIQHYILYRKHSDSTKNLADSKDVERSKSEAEQVGGIDNPGTDVYRF